MIAHTRSPSENGQASPLYIFVVASLLFLALGFFVVGHAGAVRNGAQSAADAAALAAARQSRDDVELTAANLRDVLLGVPVGSRGDGCGAAPGFAAQNQATVTGCAALADGRWGSSVEVQSSESVRGLVVPAAEGKKAVAGATAVVEPRCNFDGDDGEGPLPEKLECDDGTLDLDPADLPTMSDLFDVRLSEG
ncbi:pilus assembly protein TadG-related protein [Streptomyces sp. NPDC046887]|uniref:pilus assembly protein TadG-related protein n=1 Tax=Streptomyces sp. NPDC046887 TaxID=3155472 RepID=UPI0033E229EF